ncbi:CotH kinase family protein [bacterium]|nr:CotH kinase family protein [bacterium]
MKRVIGIFLAVLGAVVLFFVSAMSLSSSDEIDEQISLATLIATPSTSVMIESVQDINELPLEDNMNLYQYDDPSSVVYMYITIREGNAADNTNHTWEEVNDFTKWIYGNYQNEEPAKAEVILQIGDETGPLPGELGYGEVVSNGTIGIRGASTSTAAQKSYKIELFRQAGEWRGQRTIALNKHIFDISRLINKLCFDLMVEIPNMVSLRTQFVNLYVKDETTDPPSTTFVDYGLYTQIEQPNGRFLKNHLLDSDGQLYKANFFEFYRYEDQLRLIDDPLYNETAFYTILETKGSQDHTKLLQMLDDVNDLSIPIEETFAKYFDAENYFTWMAFNILVGNVDTQSQNFYLYSPKNSEKWYFIPWDYDGSLSRQNRDYFDFFPMSNWEYGVANYWGAVLHNRVLRVDSYREQLTTKIEELNEFLSEDRLEGMINTYLPVVKYYTTRLPDSYYLDATPRLYDEFIEQIPTEISNNYNLYFESLETSMPFYLGTPQAVDETTMRFNWDASYDFDAEDITYTFNISTDYLFNNILFETQTKNLNYVEIDLLESGTYFWRVIATNESGYVQYPFDHYIDPEGDMHSGVKYLYISPEGEIIEQ